MRRWGAHKELMIGKTLKRGRRKTGTRDRRKVEGEQPEKINGTKQTEKRAQKSLGFHCIVPCGQLIKANNPLTLGSG